MDTFSAIEIRGEISACERDMRRAVERASEAARSIERAMVVELSRINFDVLQAAVGDLRDAHQAHQAALKRRNELKASLGE